MQNPFGQILTAMVTPFKDDLSIDYEACEKLVNHLIKTGTDTIVVAGTTGESPTLSHEEEIELCKFVKKLVNDKVKIVFSTGSNCTRTAVEYTKKSNAYGIDGILSVVPYYNKPSQAGLIEHFSQIAESTDLPIILYNIPGRTGINMEPSTTAELANKYKNIIAYKDATGNLEHTSQIIQSCPKDFLVFSGDDSLLLPMISVGAVGVISVASYLFSTEMKDMIKFYIEGKIERAKEIHYILFPIFKALFKAPNPTCIKAALEIKGIIKSNLRPPLVKLNDKDLNELKAILEQTEKQLVGIR